MKILWLQSWNESRISLLKRNLLLYEWPQSRFSHVALLLVASLSCCEDCIVSELYADLIRRRTSRGSGENSTTNLFIEKILTNNQSSIVLSNLTTKRYMMQQFQPAWCHQSTCFEAFFHYKSKQMIWAVSFVVHL